MTNEEIVCRIRAGEIHLVERLIEENRGFTWSMARKYLPFAQRNRAVEFDDLLQAASLGMLEAIPVWEESRGAFITLAAFCMRNRILEAMGMRSSRVRVENTGTLSLDAPAGEDEDCAFVDLIVDENAVDPAAAAVETDMCRIVREAVDRLPDRPRNAIQHRIYGGKAQGNAGNMTWAIQLLRQDKLLRKLWAEYENRPYRHQTYTAWKHTHTSTTEAAAIERESILEKSYALQREIEEWRKMLQQKQHGKDLSRGGA